MSLADIDNPIRSRNVLSTGLTQAQIAAAPGPEGPPGPPADEYRLLRPSPSTDNTSGTTGNLAVGYGALSVVSSGQNNTAIGLFTLFSNTAGSGNVGIGENTLNKNKNGNNNIAVGRGALENCDSPDANIGVGTQAGKTIGPGGSNIIIGHEADVDNSGRQRCIVLGRSAVSPAIDGSLAIGGTGGNVMSGLTTTTAPTGATGTWLRIWLNGLEYRIPIQRAS